MLKWDTGVRHGRPPCQLELISHPDDCCSIPMAAAPSRQPLPIRIPKKIRDGGFGSCDPSPSVPVPAVPVLTPRRAGMPRPARPAAPAAAAAAPSRPLPSATEKGTVVTWDGDATGTVPTTTRGGSAPANGPRAEPGSPGGLSPVLRFEVPCLHPPPPPCRSWGNRHRGPPPPPATHARTGPVPGPPHSPVHHPGPPPPPREPHMCAQNRRAPGPPLGNACTNRTGTGNSPSSVHTIYTGTGTPAHTPTTRGRPGPARPPHPAGHACTNRTGPGNLQSPPRAPGSPQPRVPGPVPGPPRPRAHYTDWHRDTTNPPPARHPWTDRIGPGPSRPREGGGGAFPTPSPPPGAPAPLTMARPRSDGAGPAGRGGGARWRSQRGSAATCRQRAVRAPARLPPPRSPFIENHTDLGKKKRNTTQNGLKRCDALLGGRRQGRRCPLYLTFFLGRRLLVCPHFFLRQLTARGCRRA